MEDDVLTVKNTGDKGNPNHKPAGSPDGGQFTSAGGAGSGSPDADFEFSLEDIEEFIAENSEPEVKSNPEFDKAAEKVLGMAVINNSVHMNGVMKSFNTGSNEAKAAVLSVIGDYGVRIDYGSACYWDKTNRVYFKNPDLTGIGKYAGYHAEGATFYHEFFHAIDANFYGHGYLTSNYKLGNGKTLKDSLHDEIYENKYAYSMKMFNEIKAEYDNFVKSELKKKYSDEEIAKLYKDLKILEEINLGWKLGKFKTYKEYHDEFYRAKNNEFAVAVAKLQPAMNAGAHKYGTLSDICSFIYKTGTGSASICGGHPKKYWSQDNGDKPIREVFAELGSMWSRGDKEGIDLIRKYFPKTVDGFMEIVNNFDKIKGK